MAPLLIEHVANVVEDQRLFAQEGRQIAAKEIIDRLGDDLQC
jgi:hypothetical protein